MAEAGEDNLSAETCLRMLKDLGMAVTNEEFQANEVGLRALLAAQPAGSLHLSPGSDKGSTATALTDVDYLSEQLTVLHGLGDRAHEAAEMLSIAASGVVGRVAARSTGLVYDKTMARHQISKGSHPECPERISRIFNKIKECGLLALCQHLQSRCATDEEVESCHTRGHREKMDRLALDYSRKDLEQLGNVYDSIYLNKFTSEAARLAVGCLLELTSAVCQDRVRNGVAIIRPPGHHAEAPKCMGFCIYNNVAIAAKYAQKAWGKRRILIVDWDVHHGNGTQRMFEDDPSVLYFSVHRYDHGVFYPGTDEAAPESVGKGAGRGFSVNVGWNIHGVGDAEYLACFQRVLMPIAYEFDPDLVLVSAGFDAARGDPLGGCSVTPAGYAHMTHMLSGLADGHVVVALEGGYNLTSISDSMAACTAVLVGQAPERVVATKLDVIAIENIEATIREQTPYWVQLQRHTEGHTSPAAEEQP